MSDEDKARIQAEETYRLKAREIAVQNEQALKAVKLKAQPKSQVNNLLVFGVVAIIGAIWWITSYTNSQPTSIRGMSFASPPPSVAPSTQSISRKEVACQQKPVLNKLVRLRSSGDTKAFADAGAALLMTGDCRVFKVGETVYSDGYDFSGGVTQIRLNGSSVNFWIASEAIAQ